jgi:tyrosine-specific transport protein
VDYLNRLLAIGAVITYFIIVLALPNKIKFEYFAHSDWSATLMSVSTIMTSFGFHIIIPTLVNYMQRDVKKLQIVILIGSIIPLLVYIIWEFLILGTIPIFGNKGLMSLWFSGGQLIRGLKTVANSSSIIIGARLFSFFAITTSFLGVSLSLSDFLSDFFKVLFGYKSKETKIGKVLLCSLTLIPALIFSVLYPRIFFQALNYAGAFGVVVLLGALPACMVWSSKYRMKLPSKLKLYFGKPILIGVIVIVCAIIFIVLGEINGWLNDITNKYIS